MTASPASGSVPGFAILAALGVFVVSGGVYAGGDGPLRGAALVVGLIGVALAVVLLVSYARVSGGGRVGTPGR